MSSARTQLRTLLFPVIAGEGWTAGPDGQRVPITAGWGVRWDAGEAHSSLRFLLNPWHWPSATDGGLLAACGLIAAFGFFFLSQGYRLAEANRVAPFEYASLPWGILWGYWFFGNLPDAATLLGAGVIIGAGLYTLQRQRGTALRPE